MSTRAVYTFKDEDSEFHVYKHHDGYPQGAARWIENAVVYAWPLPRFEACEFGAAFIAGNKETRGGGVYLTTHWKDHGDLEYRYEITCDNRNHIVKAYTIRGDLLFTGTIQEFKEWTIKHDE